MGGQCEDYSYSPTKFEFVGLLDKEAASIPQMDVSHCGGIMEAKKIAGMAEAHYAMIAPHHAYGPVAAATAVQPSVCSPNFLAQEGPMTWSVFFSELVKEPIKWEKGYVIPHDAGVGRGAGRAHAGRACIERCLEGAGGCMRVLLLLRHATVALVVVSGARR